AVPVLDRIDDHVRQLLLLAIAAFAEDAELEQLAARTQRPQLYTQLLAELVMLAPKRQPILQQLLRHLGLDEMLMLGGALAHRLSRRRATRGGRECGIAARATDQGLWCPVRGLDQAHLALQASQREHAVLPERGRE